MRLNNQIPLTTVCPVCGARPLHLFPGLTPWFCSNDECRCLSWDPYSSPEANMADAHELEFTDAPAPAAGDDATQ